MHRLSALLLPLLAAALLADAPRADAPAASRLEPLPPEPRPVELAPYMGELQRLTHKLSLSVGARNHELARFYTYESIELLREIQRDVPEYDGQPIALLIDRMALPPTERLSALLARASRSEGEAESGESNDAEQVQQALDELVASCNQCHVQTLHGFIKITAETRVNPFNQDFNP